MSLDKTTAATVDNVFRITYETKWDVRIWKSTITLNEDGVMIGSANPKPENIQVAHVDRTPETINALTVAKNIDQILAVFGL